MSEFSTLKDIVTYIWDTLKFTLWFIVPLFIVFIVSQVWLFRVRYRFIKDIKWLTLEFRVPRENLRSAKSMEQVFANLHASYTFGIKFWEKWWQGKVEEWMSLEMAGFAKDIHFYIKLPAGYRNLVESALFSQYPDVEIHEAEDYTDRFGTDLPNENYDLFGADFILDKENPYPIRTYPDFEEQIEERRVDPIASIAEAMSNLKDDEMIWLQLLIRPTSDDWKKEAEDIIDEITGRKKKEAKNPIFTLVDGIWNFFKNLIWGALEYPTWPEGTKGEEKSQEFPKRLTPGEMDILKGIGNKISKLGFESVLRFIYIDKKDSFTKANISAVQGALRQFSTLNMNSLRPILLTLTTPIFTFFNFMWVRTNARIEKRKEDIFARYRERFYPAHLMFPSLMVKMPIMNIEELATIYHPPITAVGAPKLFRLETKKGEPPVNLPIEE